MTKTTKIVSGIVVGLFLIAIGVYIGSHYFVKNQVLAGTSPTGATFGNATEALIVMAPATGTATSSSYLNNSGNDWYISSIKGGCESIGTSYTAYTGTGLKAFTISIATSSTASPASNSNTNVVGSTALTIATSTVQFVVASSTASNGATSPGSTSISNIWTAGSYITLTANATNTAVCSIGVDYISS